MMDEQQEMFDKDVDVEDADKWQFQFQDPTLIEEPGIQIPQVTT